MCLHQFILITSHHLALLVPSLLDLHLLCFLVLHRFLGFLFLLRTVLSVGVYTVSGETGQPSVLKTGCFLFFNEVTTFL